MIFELWKRQANVYITSTTHERVFYFYVWRTLRVLCWAADGVKVRVRQAQTQYTPIRRALAHILLEFCAEDVCLRYVVMCTLCLPEYTLSLIWHEQVRSIKWHRRGIVFICNSYIHSYLAVRNLKICIPEICRGAYHDLNISSNVNDTINHG